MAAEQGVVRRVAWREVFPALHLVSALRQALRTRFLLISALAVLVTIAGWWLIGRLFAGSSDETLKTWVSYYSLCPWDSGAVEQIGEAGEAAMFANAPVPSSLFSPPTFAVRSSNPYGDGMQNLSAPVRQLFDMRVTLVSLAFLLLQGAWAIAVWSLFGLAMTRIAAVQLCREENIGWGAAFGYARGKFFAAFSAPVLPLLGVLVLVIPVLILGLLLRNDAAAYVSAVLWPLALVAGLLMTIIVVGLMFGWPLMSPAIATEGSDSFDAISRAYSYVYQRPLHYAWYTLLAVLLGMAGALVVNFFADALFYLTDWAASWGSGIDRTPGSLVLHRHRPEGTGAGSLIWFWSGFIHLIVIAFIYSYFWSAATQIYLLLRYETDGTELDEVFLDDEDPRGLPPLATDASGVPVVADESGEVINDEGVELTGEPPQ